MPLTVEQFTCNQDNFGLIVHDEASGLTAAIDAPETAPILTRLKVLGWRLDHILTTHHHADHVAGNLALKEAFGCRITGPAAEAAKIPGLDRTVRGGDAFAFGSETVTVIDTPGHTLGHVAYCFPSSAIVFTADALFALGCGRLLEGTAEMMAKSLARLAALPDPTRVYCGHEYTYANARFALTVDPDNADLVRRYDEVKRLRAAGKMTLPTTIAEEKRTNPYFRVDAPPVRLLLQMENAPSVDVFAEIRRRKDGFK